MTDKKYNLPPRKWYTLEQAIKHIQKLTGEELEIADLLHYWRCNKLDLRTPIKYNRETLVINGEILEIEELNCFYIQDFGKDIDALNIDDFCNIIPSHILQNFSLEMDDALTEIPLNSNFLFNGRIDGFVSLIPPLQRNNIFMNALLDIDSTDNAFPECFCIYREDKEPLFIEYNLNKTLKIDKKFLFIIEGEIERFFMQNSFAIQAQSIREQKTGNKTLNLQAEFIRNLITIFYNEETANNIRSAIDNGKIKRDFELRGLSLPSGKTVDKWINS